MTGPLYAIGRFCSRHHWLTIAVWVVAAVALVLIGQAGESKTNDNLTLPGTDSTVATELLEDNLPEQAFGSNPLVFQATRPIPLLDAIARAGGIREDAGSDIVVSKEVMRDGKPARIIQTIPVRKLIDNADPALNVMLHGGEEVLVLEALKIYVVGNVKKPGAYPVRNDEETTILQVLALSEGLTPYSAKVAYVYRRSPGGTKTEVPVPLAKIMKRQSPDVPLQANDILYIPDNNGKRLTAETLDRIAGLGTATATDYIIWH